MKKILEFAKEYYVLSAMILVALIGLGLRLDGYESVAKLLISTVSVLMAFKLAWGMIGTLREGRYGIDILAVTAIISTVAVGEYWAAIVIVLMLTGGEALEDYAERRAQTELTALMERAPVIAHRLGAKGVIEDIPVTEVKVGDQLVVKPAEIIPVDATLVEAKALFDESSLTGESLPVEHSRGDQLLSGSVNGNELIHITATQEAADSQYQRIIELVKAASSSEAPFVRLADRYAVPFTIIAFAIAGGAAIIAGSWLRFAEVLVVATPCPLLLGAPIALISGMSRAAKNGIIIKSGGILEKLATIKTVAFDKTGTLTYGQPEVHKVLPAHNFSAERLVSAAASIEQSSTHTLAQALVDYAKSKKYTLVSAKKVEESTAQGMSGFLKNDQVVLGKLKFLESQGIAVKTVDDVAGQTSIYVAINGHFAGVITFADTLRENSKETLSQLHALGIKRVMMLTGDSKGTAQRIAAEIGIDDVRAECLPEDKVHAVKRATDKPVMMVGDGVNDAPVLAAADIGLAMGARGSTAASETADVVVLVDDISKAATAIRIAQQTLKIALQSVWIGIIISVGLMAVAATGRIPAVVGAGLQEVVDVVVIINALRAHGPYGRKKA